MKSEKAKRKVQSIHLGDGKYLGARTVQMELFGGGDLDDEMETLAKLYFKVNAAEYAVMAKLGMVDTDAASEESEQDFNIVLRTDRDLVDEEEETLGEEWEDSLDDPTCELSVWVNLDFWEVESVN